ncbi:DUF2723 domain-containing protein [archaeon]|nr:MAG: DUF2723 domain-containing protein [archaeon]
MPHPPGYPLFTMLSHLAMKVPMVKFTVSSDWSLHMDSQPTPAWKVNHMCCIFGALAAILVGNCACHILMPILQSSTTGQTTHPIAGSRVASLASIYFAFSPLVWEYAISAEVFALNNFFCALLLWLTILIIADLHSWVEQGRPGAPERVRSKVLVGALTSALALCNQHTSLLHVSFLVMIAVVALFWHGYPEIITVLVTAAVVFSMGLSPYLYLIYASRNIPPGSWGDTTTLQGFWKHVLRAEYGTFRLGGILGEESWLQRIYLYLQFVSRESHHVVFPAFFIALIVFAICLVGSTSSSEMKSLSQGVARVAQQRGGKQAKSKKTTQHANTVSPPSAASNTAQSVPLRLSIKLVGVVLTSWLFYLVVWHCVFSNLPLNAPMPYGVHARFWMQPGIALHVLFGTACGMIWYCFAEQFSLCKFPMVEVGVLILATAVLLRYQFPLSNKSHTGDILSKYAYSTMSVIQPYSLVLSHSDLDWNPMRYIRTCEGAFPDRNITHLSAQILPYPWFPRQLEKYKQFHLPDVTFKGVSTDRYSEGNARLLINLFTANGIKPSTQPVATLTNTSSIFAGGIYIEMQAINEAEIGNSGMWRNIYTLVPWGSQYRVFPLLGRDAIEQVQVWSVAILQQFMSEFGTVTTDILDQYPLGTWEAGAISVYYDAQYQLGLNLLTFVIETMADKSAMGSIERVAIVLDRLAYSQYIMTAMIRNVIRYETINSGGKDVVKNTALASLRLLHMMLGLRKIELPLRQACEALYLHNKVCCLFVIVICFHSISFFVISLLPGYIS